MSNKVTNVVKVIIFVFFMLIFNSCVIYYPTVAYQNDTISMVKSYKFIGIVSYENKLGYSSKLKQKGAYSFLLEAAKKRYGETVDDVIDIKATKRYDYYGLWVVPKIIFEGRAIKYDK